MYQGYKVMPYSTACNTPLSNFEAGLNYKDVRDPAVTVAFPVGRGVCLSRSVVLHGPRLSLDVSCLLAERRGAACASPKHQIR